MKTTYLLLLLVCVGFVSATDTTPNNNDLSLDLLYAKCSLYQKMGWMDTQMQIDCNEKLAGTNGVPSSIDSSNKLTQANVDDALEGGNSVKDVETALIESNLEQTKARTYLAWANIISVVILLLEAVKIFFFALQLFLLVHLPYFYVKMLVWIKKVAGNAAGRRGA